MAAASTIEVRSYRNVFDLERRIYRIDSLRLNPGGVPVRGLAYCVAIELVVLVLGTLPLAGSLLSTLPWYVRDAVLPVGGAALLSMVHVEGRPFHLAAFAMARYMLASRELCGLRPYCSPGPGRRWSPPDLLFVCDGSEPRFRHLRFTGPGATVIALPHACVVQRARPGGGARLALRSLPGGRPLRRRRALELERGARMTVGSAPLPAYRRGRSR